MKAIVACFFLAILAGCNKPPPKELNPMELLEETKLQHCGNILEHLLRSPSTLKVISKTKTLSHGKGNDFFSLEYDAANAYGTPVRNRIVCTFKPQSEHPQIEAELETVEFDGRSLSASELSGVVLRIRNKEASELQSKLGKEKR